MSISANNASRAGRKEDNNICDDTLCMPNHLYGYLKIGEKMANITSISAS